MRFCYILCDKSVMPIRWCRTPFKDHISKTARPHSFIKEAPNFVAKLRSSLCLLLFPRSVPDDWIFPATDSFRHRDCRGRRREEAAAFQKRSQHAFCCAKCPRSESARGLVWEPSRGCFCSYRNAAVRPRHTHARSSVNHACAHSYGLMCL